MKHKHLFALALTLAAVLLPPALRAEDTNKWSFDVSLYGLFAGMSGNAGIGPVNADADVGFDQVWDNLKFGGMGTARVGYDRWAISTDVIYMELETTKGSSTAQAKQWMVQPALEYSFCRAFGIYAGTRYNNIDMKLSRPLVNPSDKQAWWDPVIGSRILVPIVSKLSFGVSGDIGGFGVNSDLTWQAFPFLNWQFTKLASLQAGYRWIYDDYENGSGLSRFKYEILTQGPQLGFTLHF